MIWINHSNLEGKHAFLSASNYHWLNYDDEKLARAWANRMAAAEGTEMHDLACRLIRHGIRLPKTKNTFNLYVNDALTYHMTPEVTLFYSDICFGTADTICFDERKQLLRIHDLKTGLTPASFSQLMIYAGLFCLEYGQSPRDISYELRLYQSDEVGVYNPGGEDVAAICNRIIHCDAEVRKCQGEVLSA